MYCSAASSPCASPIARMVAGTFGDSVFQCLVRRYGVGPKVECELGAGRRRDNDSSQTKGLTATSFCPIVERKISWLWQEDQMSSHLIRESFRERRGLLDQ